MSASLRRGACPGLSVPMATGDGLLARLTPTDRIGLAAFIGLCAAARRHGNGTIEVTARGGLQARGLTAASAPKFAAEVGALAIPASEGVPIEGPLRLGPPGQASIYFNDPFGNRLEITCFGFAGAVEERPPVSTRLVWAR